MHLIAALCFLCQRAEATAAVKVGVVIKRLEMAG
jgi:hypothetical protein